MNIFLQLLNNIKNKFLNLTYPKHIKCIFCGEDMAVLNNFDCCENCSKTLPVINKDFCIKCGMQMPDDAVGVCQNCKKENFSFDYARAVFRYDDNIKYIIHKLKYGNGKYLAEPLANYMYELLITLNWPIDIITYVPLHLNRERKRTYNQAKQLAYFISVLSNIEMKDMFQRVKDTETQTQLNRIERKNNIKDAFKLKDNSGKEKNILIIDDVFTTGATTNELAKILKDHKAKNVYILTLAHSCIDREI